jgi:hypothetical protein
MGDWYMKIRIDKMISLGSTCSTRHHLERLHKKYKPETVMSSYFFDWLWRNGGFESSLSVLQESLVLEREDFCLEPVYNHHYEVFNRRHKIFFLHDFEFKDPSITADLNQLNGEMEIQFDSFIQKYEHLATKTRRIIEENKNLAFVYAIDGISEAQAKAFFDLLADNYHASPLLIHLPDTSKNFGSPDHENVISRPFRHDSPWWSGFDDQWEMSLGEIISTGFAEVI